MSVDRLAEWMKAHPDGWVVAEEVWRQEHPVRRNHWRSPPRGEWAGWTARLRGRADDWRSPKGDGYGLTRDEALNAALDAWNLSTREKEGQ